MTVSASLDAFVSQKRDHFVPLVAALWLVACVAMVALHWHNLATFQFPDVDDQLRLVEVRDWIGGQSFFDVSQHRMNQPFGAPMHWSRLVDMPIAALILALRPVLGAAMAERITVAAVPLLTLGVAMLGVGLIARRLAGRAPGLLAAAFTPTAVAAMVQLQPNRIDHHGWEMALSLLALLAVLRADGKRGGLLAGIAAAVALQISLEVLPFAVALGGVLGLHWLLVPGREARGRLVAYVCALAIGEALLFFSLHGADRWSVHCDAISPPHLLGLAIAAAGVAVVSAFDPKPLWQRVAGLGATALAAGAAFHAVPPGCGIDAFSSLEPIVRTYWYDKIAEGQPVWRDDFVTAAGIVGFPLLALPCAVFGWREHRRWEWGLYAAMLAASTAVAILVVRAGALANLVALPAAAYVTIRLLTRVQASGQMLVRVFGSVAVLTLFSPWAIGAAAMIALPGKDDAKPATAHACDGIANIRALRALPPARIFALFDFGPAILLETRHAVLASSHHRNHVAMAQELTAWLGSDDAAHRILRDHGMAYVVACPDHAEMETYAKAAPQGFAAHLATGRAPGWLTPVTLPGTTRFGLWKVVD